MVVRGCDHSKSFTLFQTKCNFCRNFDIQNICVCCFVLLREFLGVCLFACLCLMFVYLSMVFVFVFVVFAY